jgi:23S rRNA pseudouridine955/2504/2580 synthase
MELITGENDNGRRLDRILRKALPGHPLPLIHRLLRQGRVFVDGKPAKAQERVDCGAKISIPSLKDAPKSSAVPSLPAPEPQPSPANQRFTGEGFHPDIIWEAPGLIAVNKPAGLEVHGLTTRGAGGKTSSHSLDAMVRSFLSGKITHSLSFKPGPLHRLDKPSSGIVVFSTSIEGARLFSSLMCERKVRKTYLAIVEGNVKNEEIWEDELIRDKEKKKTFVCDGKNRAGKNAVTKITPLATKNNYTLVAAEIATGRTHQIRAQASSHGHPLYGDKKYGGHGKDGLYLHAWKLEFSEYSIEAPPPEDFRKKTTELFGADI